MLYPQQIQNDSILIWIASIWLWRCRCQMVLLNNINYFYQKKSDFHENCFLFQKDNIVTLSLKASFRKVITIILVSWNINYYYHSLRQDSILLNPYPAKFLKKNCPSSIFRTVIVSFRDIKTWIWNSQPTG